MEAIAYSFGGDVVIRAGEAALCGVTGAVLREKAERCDVLEFLTDKPVARLKSREFQLELKLKVPRGGDPEELVELVLGGEEILRRIHGLALRGLLVPDQLRIGSLRGLG